MKQFLSYSWLGLVVLVVLALDVFSVLPPRFPRPMEKTYLEGIFHVHSTYSHDGGGSIEEIAQAANNADIDFVFVTDHNTNQGFLDGKEGVSGKTDIFIEDEVSIRLGHVVTVYTHTSDRKLDKKTIGGYAQEQVIGNKRFHPDTFQVIAHPTSLKHPWTQWDRITAGMEIINFDSLWRRQLHDAPLNFLTTLGLSFVNPFLSAIRFYDVSPKSLEMWDHANSVSSGHFGILGQDSHQRLALPPLGSIAWPSYERDFKIAANVIRPPEKVAADFPTRKQQIYKWIREGRFAVFFRLLHPYDGYNWNLHCGSDRYSSGDRIAFRDCRHVFSVPNSPYPHTVRVWKDGALHSEVPVHAVPPELPLEGPGTYRVEVWAKVSSRFGITVSRAVPIVLFNPIYVE